MTSDPQGRIGGSDEFANGFSSDSYIMAILVVEFSSGGYKIGKIFPKKPTYSKEMIEF